MPALQPRASAGKGGTRARIQRGQLRLLSAGAQIKVGLQQQPGQLPAPHRGHLLYILMGQAQHGGAAEIGDQLSEERNRAGKRVSHRGMLVVFRRALVPGHRTVSSPSTLGARALLLTGAR